MIELSVAVGAGEPGPTFVGHEVVFEAVLPGEGGLAPVTFEGPLTCVTLEMGQ